MDTVDVTNQKHATLPMAVKPQLLRNMMCTKALYWLDYIMSVTCGLAEKHKWELAPAGTFVSQYTRTNPDIVAKYNSQLWSSNEWLMTNLKLLKIYKKGMHWRYNKRSLETQFIHQLKCEPECKTYRARLHNMNKDKKHIFDHISAAPRT